MPLELAQADIVKERLKPVLEDWCPVLPGYHLYYPSRRHLSRAMAVLIDALRYPPTEK